MSRMKRVLVIGDAPGLRLCFDDVFVKARIDHPELQIAGVLGAVASAEVDMTKRPCEALQGQRLAEVLHKALLGDVHLTAAGEVRAADGGAGRGGELSF